MSSSIITNVSSLLAQNNLASSQTSLQTSLQRLSTGLKINTGADDPSGLIASQGLQAEISGINQAVDNSTQAINVISTADGALSQVESLLQSIEGLVVQSANTGALSSTEIQANQLQVDSAISSITRIANSTTFDGLQLLDGGLDFVTSGVNQSDISGLQITQANFGNSPTIPVSVKVITSAQTASLKFLASAVKQPVTLSIQGNDGVQNISLASNATASQIVQAINQDSSSTGVQAAFIDPTNANSGVVFTSLGYGSAQYISVQVQNGGTSAFQTVNSTGETTGRATGQDAVAEVNGVVTTGTGLSLAVDTGTLDLNLTLNPDFTNQTTNFTIVGGGATFQLGAEVNAGQQVTLGIQSVAAADLGNATVGYLNDLLQGGTASLANNPGQASQIIDAAIQQVAVLRGQIGAFQANTLETNINSLNIALENVSSSESDITDANFAAETSNLTRAQILVQAGTTVLATANSVPQTILKLLTG
ncbi:MAG TPA: flagellin [Tepidisphaeraceae bacterium]|nr:flagellin [Tepidisphaeraceae bacterium]